MAKSRRAQGASSAGRGLIAPRETKPNDSAPVPVSLPLQDVEDAEATSLQTTELPPHLRLPEDSKIRATAIKIWIMEQAGIPRDEVAKTLGLSPKSIAGYLYKAGRNGWLDFDDAKAELEYSLMPKVLRNLAESLDGNHVLANGSRERVTTALKIAEGALFPKMAPTESLAPSTVVGIKIQVVGGTPDPIREGAVMGVDRYIDAETIEDNGGNS